ncbi:MAG: aldo/keto reductase [Anaerolineales bacterium]|jgi:aryl-alcohol dehydrogenase-like predicted oxidoreductase
MSSTITERISLGISDLHISPLGMGTNAWGYSRRADPAKQPVLEAALAGGINFIDTAEVYNFSGSEKTLGLLLPKYRAEVVLATKFFPYPWRLAKSSLEAALRASLRRLGVPQVDLYILHFPVPPVSLETWVEALADVQQAGLTRAVGISNCNSQQTRRAQAVLARRGIPLASNQVEYSLLNRSAERSGLLETCRELGVMLVAYRPLGYGLLTGKYKPEDLPAVLHGRLIRRSDLQRVSPLIEQLGELARSHGKTPAQVALNWIMCKGAVPIPGAKNPNQAAQNAGALGWRLDAAEVEALDKQAARLP